MEPTPEQILEWIRSVIRNVEDLKWAAPVDNLLCVCSAIARIAYQAGADAELEECCDWVDEKPEDFGIDGSTLYDARRPKPPSLKEQALEAFEALLNGEDSSHFGAIREALESLPDD
jgi:hypothetical protein